MENNVIKLTPEIEAAFKNFNCAVDSSGKSILYNEFILARDETWDAGVYALMSRNDVCREPKPIVLVYYKRMHNGLELYEVQDALSKQLSDYYVIVIPQSNDKATQLIGLNVFYSKYFTSVQYDELKKIVEDSITTKVKEKTSL